MIPKLFTRYPILTVAMLLAVGLLITSWGSLLAPTFIAHEESVLRLPLLSSLKNLPTIFSRDFTMFTDGQFRPMSYAVLAAVRTFIPAGNVLFWHLWLLVFHGANAILVFLLVRRFSKHLWSAGLAAAIFAWHPLASVVTNDINAFHYVLGLTCYLGALGCYLSFSDTLRKRTYIAGLILFVLGLFTSKILFTLPPILVCYELLYRRMKVRAPLGRLLPFAACSLFLSPLWLWVRPHPLHYTYIKFPEGTGWNSFFSVIGATEWYAKGLLFGWKLAIPLGEVVEHIYRFRHWKLLLWGGIDLALMGAGVWALYRKHRTGLGVLLLLAPMIPFVSTSLNGVEHYVSWVYLYFPLAGLSLVIGVWGDILWPSRWRSARGVVWTVLCLAVILFGVQQTRLNIASRSAVGFWTRVLRLSPNSEIASFELGKGYLAQGEKEYALKHLFSPQITKLYPSCLAMSRYYTDQGAPVAAAIHLRMVSQREDGLRYQNYEMAAAPLFVLAGAPDYAEEALGRALMANPFNLAGLEQLAQVFALKGYVPAAERLLVRAEEFASPHSEAVFRMRKRLQALQDEAVPCDTSQGVHPPDPGWLKFVTQTIRDPEIRKSIIQAGESHPEDPIIQMEAGICLVGDGQLERALPKMDFAVRSLPSCAYAWALKCWALVEAGAYSEAQDAGRRAQELDPSNPTVLSALGFLFSTLASTGENSGPSQVKMEQAIEYYRSALRLNPRYARAHNNLANLLVKKGEPEEAIEHYRQALRITPDYVEAHCNLGLELARKGKSGEAIEHYRQALRIMPHSALTHNNLGITLASLGQSEEAIAHFQKAVHLDPNSAEAHNNLGIAYARQGKSGEAITNFRKAAGIRPGFAEAQANLFSALMSGRRFDEALSTLRERLTHTPNSRSTVLSLAWLLATCPKPNLRNGAEAVQLLERIGLTTGNRNPMALDILAAAYAESGRFDEAIRTAQEALRLVASSGRAGGVSEQLEMRLTLYRMHRAYHTQ
ncbi:MAG: tetratricopeptide repeat protein [Candidatus Latescibacterota bacterium]